MTYEEASALVKRFVDSSTENQKAKCNEFAPYYVIGQLTSLLSISLSGGNIRALNTMIKMTEEIELNNQTPNENE